ncbi:AAA-domain-containing protein [Amniculicola lignicola CBS 123094]|uniref:AAA-domain-containing protein n=1 Tax=Amniculicola lignicola CBS 123094 TaxID=1392246 RepID=A0A6A5WFI0_9PLEO|nr:AAA-domain-containing protein [Amniculicola lignicola CBS 123094]
MASSLKRPWVGINEESINKDNQIDKKSRIEDPDHNPEDEPDDEPEDGSEDEPEDDSKDDSEDELEDHLDKWFDIAMGRSDDSKNGAKDGLHNASNDKAEHDSKNSERPPHPDDAEFRPFSVAPGDNSTTFADVHVNSEALEALDVLALTLHDPDAFKVGVLANSPHQGVLLYGPPGTGKTLLAKALANQGNATLLSLTSADIRCMYVGQGEKKIKGIFQYAHRHHPCIIFIDEADALFRTRSSESTSRGHMEDITQFLIEMDGIRSNSKTSPIVIAATNRPFDIDEGILRRLPRRIMVGIPDYAAREHIMKIFLKDEIVVPDAGIPELLRQTEGYSGSDLRNLVQAAAYSAVREIRDFQLRGLKPPGFSTILAADGKPHRRVLRKAHFLRAKQEIRASPNKDTVAKIRDFHNKFGNTSQRVALDLEFQKPEVVNKGKGAI